MFSATKSRNEARLNKEFVFRRCKGHCELCGDFQPFTLECHHIIPVCKGGHGYESNLIALCPNCHAVIEKLRTNTIDNPHFHDWIRNRYGKDGYTKFGKLLQCTWENGSC